MKALSAIVVGDLHLNMNVRDEYRWGFFEKRLVAFQRKTKAPHLILLGDLTDKKDRHDAYLVNRLCNVLELLSRFYTEIHILKGNHDYIDPEVPFFDFLNKMRPKVTFYSKPTYWYSKEVLFLPHTPKPLKEWSRIFSDFIETKYIFLHQGLLGAKTSSGYELKDGLVRSFFDSVSEETKIISGDIHTPQMCGRVEYIGTPYPINFNDAFKTKVICFDRGARQDIRTSEISRKTIEVNYLNELKRFERRGLRFGTQLKVRMMLPSHEISEWLYYKREIKEFMKSMKCENHGIELIPLPSTAKKIRKNRKTTLLSNDPEEQYSHYCEIHGLKDSALEISGKEVLKDLKDVF